MVRCVENPSFRLASCVSVDVVNGAAGRSTPGFASTFVTVHGRWRFSASTSAAASASDSRRTFFPVSTPCASKSLPLATRTSPMRVSVPPKVRPSAENCASRSE